MNEPAPNPEMSLADLAAAVRAKAEKYVRSQKGEEFTDRLRQRLAHIDPLAATAAGLVQSRKLVASTGLRVRLPRQNLSPKLKKIEKLAEAVVLDVARAVEDDAIDVPGLKTAFTQAEEFLLENWQKFARPKTSVAGAAALESVPELAETVRQIRAVRQQLEAAAKTLPGSAEKVATVRELQKQLATLGDTLRTHGCDDDVLAFLAQARTADGVALADAVKNSKLLAWLAVGRNADALRIIHKSVLNPTAFRP